MKVRFFKLTHSETYWDGKVEIDEANPATAEAIKNMVQFWMGWEDTLEESDGDYTTAFLKMLGKKLVLMQIRLGYNLKGIISEMADEEGWYPLDGSHGIKLARCDPAEISDSDIFISEETA